MTPEPLVGSWKLSSFVITHPDGRRTEPFGQAPIGLAVFTEDGWASAHLMRTDRRKFADPDIPPSPEEAQDALRGFVAYFGRYQVDTANQVLTTRVEGSANPNWIGGDQVRNYEFRGEQLVLRPPMREGPTGPTQMELCWDRA